MKFRRGDIVKLNFNPVKGHEQGDYRPALVMNDCILPGGVSIVLPITTKQKSYPFEVELDGRTATTGVILCFQIRTIDLEQRGARFVERLPDDLTDLCSDYVHRLTTKL